MSIMQINTYGEYKAISRNISQVGRPFINNNFMMKNRLVDLIESNCLFYEAGNNYVCIYVKEKDCCRLLIQAINPNEVIVRRQDLPVRFDYTFLSNPLLEESIATIMKNNHFQQISRNQEMNLKKAKVKPYVQKPHKKIHIRQAMSCEVIPLSKIWAETMTEEINPIPNEKELRKNLDHVFVLLAKGELAGGARIIPRGNRIYIEQVAIGPNYQGMGYGVALLAFFERLFPDKDVYLWVSSRNEHALAIYDKFGFEKSGKLSVQYILKEYSHERKNYQNLDGT